MLARPEPDLLLSLVGPLRLVRSGGADITPRSAKAQGILALVATSPALRRPRTFLQDKLWSESDSEQGATSLRQTLMRLRRALGTEQDVLTSEAGWIGLDPRRVALRLEPLDDELERPGAMPEFCDGLDIVDPEFEDWIRDCRLAFEDRWTKLRAERQDRPVRPALVVPETRPYDGLAIVIQEAEAPDAELAALAEAVTAQVAAQVGRLWGVRLLIAPVDPAVTRAEGSIGVGVKASGLGRCVILQAQLTDLSSGTLLWMAQREFPTRRPADPDTLARFVAEVATALALEIGRGGPGTGGSALRRAYRALRVALSFDHKSLERSERDLAAAEDLPGAAVRWAWRANIRLIAAIERIAANPEESEHEAIEFAARALEEDPLNPIVNALASDVALHLEGRPLKAMELARAAVARDGGNPFAFASYAQTLSHTGSARAAHDAALRALGLAIGQPNQAWWTMLCCVTALRTGRRTEALRFAQIAHEVAPSFRPPLRFIAALRYRAHDEGGAVEALWKLKALEPDFSLDLMASDNYPVRTLRQSGLLEIARSKLL
jgi:hypothetical protein